MRKGDVRFRLFGNQKGLCAPRPNIANTLRVCSKRPECDFGRRATQFLELANCGSGRNAVELRKGDGGTNREWTNPPKIHRIAHDQIRQSVKRPRSVISNPKSRLLRSTNDTGLNLRNIGRKSQSSQTDKRGEKGERGEGKRREKEGKERKEEEGRKGGRALEDGNWVLAPFPCRPASFESVK